MNVALEKAEAYLNAVNDGNVDAMEENFPFGDVQRFDFWEITQRTLTRAFQRAASANDGERALPVLKCAYTHYLDTPHQDEMEIFGPDTVIEWAIAAARNGDLPRLRWYFCAFSKENAITSGSAKEMLDVLYDTRLAPEVEGFLNNMYAVNSRHGCTVMDGRRIYPKHPPPGFGDATPIVDDAMPIVDGVWASRNPHVPGYVFLAKDAPPIIDGFEPKAVLISLGPRDADFPGVVDCLTAYEVEDCERCGVSSPIDSKWKECAGCYYLREDVADNPLGNKLTEVINRAFWW